MTEDQDKYEPGDSTSTPGVSESASMLTGAEIKARAITPQTTPLSVPSPGLPVFLLGCPNIHGGDYDYYVYTTEREALLAALHYLGDDMDEAAKIEGVDALDARMNDAMDTIGDYVLLTTAWLFAEPANYADPSTPATPDAQEG